MIRSISTFFLMTLLTLSVINAKADTRIIADPSKAETVFDWSHDRCFDQNIPDSPARAFRISNGQVHLYATHYKNVPLIGRSLAEVHPSCDIRFSGNMNPDPEAYNARIWLQTFYSMGDGKNIYSLASSDYHGKWFKNCKLAGKSSQGCWWSAIVLAHSQDEGQSFKILPAPRQFVARSPAKFSSREGGPIGFLTTSNIVKLNNYYYSLFNVAAHKDQQGGNCIARTSNLADPTSWRAWDGKHYTQTLAYSSPDSKGLSCKTLRNLPYKIRTLVWHTESQRYVAIFEKTRRVARPAPRTDVDFSFSWSSDLIRWEAPKTIISLKGDESCRSSQAPGAYPSLIDSESTDVNFGKVGTKAHLYYTKFNLAPNCQLSLDRDLIRIPVQILTN